MSPALLFGSVALNAAPGAVGSRLAAATPEAMAPYLLLTVSFATYAGATRADGVITKASTTGSIVLIAIAVAVVLHAPPG